LKESQHTETVDFDIRKSVHHHMIQIN